MQISVVIPCFNRAHTIQRAIHSVLEQTSPVNEIIVVDDGSSDNSAERVAKEFPQVILLRQQNAGVSSARNLGIDQARHEWIALLDSDDAWLPQKIAKMREAHKNHSGYALYHSDEIWVRNGKRVNAMRKHRKTGGWIFEHCLPLCAISPSASVIDKSVLQSVGKFDESLPACEDYDLWLRLCHRYPVFYLDEALITKYGGHPDQLSRQFPAMDQFRIRAIHQLLLESTLNEHQRQAALAMMQQKLEILLNGACKHKNHKLLEEFEPIQTHWFGERVISC
ncbi:MAG: glycosyltransferase [Pseudomonadota bacterium]